jgi:hypothetical protein
MRSALQLLGGVAVAGVVAAGSTAMTGMGMTSSQSTQFIGGTVTQTITGANLTSIVYNPVGVTGTEVDKMTITLTGATGKAFTLVTTNGVGSTDTGYQSATLWSCSDAALSAAKTATIAVLASNTVICEPSTGSVAGTYIGLYSVSVTIA